MENRIPYNEFINDLEYMPSMDSAWHSWCQPKYREQKEKWEKKLREKENGNSRTTYPDKGS